MTRRHFTFKRAATALSLSVSIFLMAFSCQDHVVPDPPELPEIQTLSLVVDNNGVLFKLAFTKIGDVPVTEYGIFYKVVGDNFIEEIPTESNSKTVFTQNITTAEVSRKQSFATGVGYIYYRAYAKLANGSMIMGEVKNAALKSD